MAPTFERTRFADLLKTLVDHGVEFVVVGGGAAVLAGAWYSTDDLDIVPSYERANLERLVTALGKLNARYLDFAGRTIEPDLAKLESFRLNLIQTELGRLGVLRAIGHDRRYADLLSRSREVELAGFVVLAADLEVLIEAKEVAGREKDRAHLPILREALRLRREKEGS